MPAHTQVCTISEQQLVSNNIQKFVFRSTKKLKICVKQSNNNVVLAIIVLVHFSCFLHIPAQFVYTFECLEIFLTLKFAFRASGIKLKGVLNL